MVIMWCFKKLQYCFSLERGGVGGSQKEWHDACLEEKWGFRAFLAESSARCLIWSQMWVQTGSWWAKKNKESVGRTRALLYLAGLPAQLLPGGRLVQLRFRAGVGAPVEGRHRAAFAVCVKAAVRRVVCLAVPFGLFECTDCDSTNTQAQLQNAKIKDGGGSMSGSTHPAALTQHSASSGRRCLAGECGFSASWTGYTQWLCQESVLGKPEKQAKGSLFACLQSDETHQGSSSVNTDHHHRPCFIPSSLLALQISFLLTFSPCKAGTESRKPWKLSLMWSLRLRSSALWCARLSACKDKGQTENKQVPGKICKVCCFLLLYMIDAFKGMGKRLYS